MRNRLIAAAIAAFFMFPVFGLTAYATELNELPDAAIVADDDIVADDAEGISDVDDPGEAPESEPEETHDIEADPGDMAALLSMFMLMGMAGDNAPVTSISPLPPGTASVIDFNTDPDGRLFYTIMTPDEHVFYLVIDKSGSTENVYFLNAVTISDLAALAELPPQVHGAAVTNPPQTAETPAPQTETPPPADTPENGGNTGMYIIIGILVVGGGGAGWYFKIYRPKQQGMGSGDEYDPSMNDTDNDYSDDWGDDTGEADDGDDSPPWDEESVGDNDE
jgi:hypothetical protein